MLQLQGVIERRLIELYVTCDAHATGGQGESESLMVRALGDRRDD